MKKFLLILWQFPQCLVGSLFYLFNRIKSKKPIKRYITFDGIIYYLMEYVNDCGITLGEFIFLDSDRSLHTNDIMNEYGHVLQSKMLGPFYIFIVGIPSLLINAFDRIFHKKWTNESKIKWYFSKFPENWANKLGGASF